MTDRLLKPTENNIIDAVRKLASSGVRHNFCRNSDVIAFNSELANIMFRKITSNADAKVSLSFNSYYDDSGKKSRDTFSWLEISCAGFYVAIDNNIFFELEEDKVAFILRFSEEEHMN